MALKRITEEEMNAQGVIAAPDILNGTPAQNKAIFDRMVRSLVAPAVNACVDAVEEVNQNETEKNLAEQERKTAEAGRVEAEKRRVAAEQARVDSTNGIVAQATEQAQAAKASADGARALAEAAAASATSADNSALAAADSASDAAESSSSASDAAEAAKAAQAAAEKARDEAQGAVGGDFATKTEAEGYANTAESNAKSYTDQKIAAIPAPDVSGQINAHNADVEAHPAIQKMIADKKGAQVYEATIGTNWAENEDTGVKTQTVSISGVTASNTAKVDHSSASINGTSDGYATFVEEENQYLTYITNGFAETVAGGIKFTIFGDAPTVSIPIVVEVV